VNTPAQIHPRKQNRLQLWLLIALFALPSIGAWLFFANPHWLPAGRTNHGHLIEPPRDMQSLVLEAPGGAAFDWRSLQDQWTLVILAQGHCDAACIERLIKLRQIRRALGANQQRIERLLILLPNPEGKQAPPSLAGLEGTRLALVDDAAAPALQEQFAIPQTDLEHAVFVIDPRIHLMMVHDLSHLTTKQVLQDLEKLLKASQSWVKGGQYGHQ
jgi:hypothetical protein